MSVFAYARHGARVGVCVLALGAAGAAAQQVQSENPIENSGQSATSAAGPTDAKAADTVTSAEPSEATAPAPGTSTLPELVVDGDAKKKEKKKAQAKSQNTSPSSTASPTSEPSTPPPGVILGGGVPSDTGATTFDAGNVQIRSNGRGDANSAFRNLPNVQFQNQSQGNAGASSQTTIDSKPQLLSISGGRTYENNFIVNGVSVSNILGPSETGGTTLTDTGTPSQFSIYGQSPQSIYVPTEFVGQATIIDSNASAEYGQFQGGVVVYDLTAPPTDRYHASVSWGYESSDYASYVLATPGGINPNNRQAPTFEKDSLAVSVGAPITKDFAFIAQASRKEAESSKQEAIQLGNDFIPESSDNIFMRFAATARTDIGKFTLDTSYTKYFQRWALYNGNDVYLDTNTKSSSTKLEYDTNLSGVRVDDIGLGKVKLKARAFYNDSETQNNSGASQLFTHYKQYLTGYTTAAGWTENYKLALNDDWCPGVDKGTFKPSTPAAAATTTFTCIEGGYGNTLQGQTDYGVNAIVTGDVLLGGFKVGAELKKYEGNRAREADYTQGTTPKFIGADGKVYNALVPQVASNNAPTNPTGQFVCNGAMMCSETEYIFQYSVFPKYDISETVNALHAFTEIDQTWQWFNVRAGARLDYDDYMENINVAPRLAGTVTPFDGVSLTGGYNRYYLGETLYYAIRDKLPRNLSYTRNFDPSGVVPAQGTPSATPLAYYRYNIGALDTPYSDEYTTSLRVRDPLLNGLWRFKYLERYGEDQFATVGCGNFCFTATNGGEKFYRSATAEYTKQWDNLKTPFYLNAAAVTGNVTWSEQRTSGGTYLINADLNGDGTAETRRIYYSGASYLPDQFNEITGNLDIPVRFGATLATVWFDGFLELNASAGINLGFMGVYDTTNLKTDAQIGKSVGCTPACYEYGDRKFGATLKLDVSGQINVTEQAAIQFRADNITNSDQNALVTSAYNDNPWVLGRSYWVGSALRF
jgi:hypothetical protein